MSTKNNKIYIYYCKCRKEAGDPVMIAVGKSKIWCKSVTGTGNINWNMSFNNAPTIAKQSGATTVLAIDIEGEEYDG